jgi:hypothetical protein
MGNLASDRWLQANGEIMERTHISLAIALSTTLFLGCGASSDAGDAMARIGVVQQELELTHFYLRCNATGFNPTSATRLKPTGQTGVYSLNYSVTQPWMVTNADHCSFTETNQLDGWGTFQEHYGATGSDPLIVPTSAAMRKTGADWFNVRYPAQGGFTVTLTLPSGNFTIQSSGSCTPTVENCNGIDDDCDGLVDESYLCMPAATAPTIDQLITTCPSAAVLNAIDQDFDMRFEFIDENGDGVLDDPAPQGNALRCTTASGSRNLTQSQERTYQALIALRALQFTQPLPFTNLNLYAWMRNSIRGIRTRSDVSESFCCTPPPGASGNYINIQNNSNRSDYITDLWAEGGGGGLFARAQLFVHETRHANGPVHTCGGNDLTIGELGAWGAVYHFSRAVAFNSNACFVRPTPGRPPTFPGQLFTNDAYLIDARTYSRSVHTGRFCAEPSVPAQPPEAVFPCGG